MASGTTTSHAYISTISGSCVWSDAKFGSNGATGGADEVGIGTDSDRTSTRRTWDADNTPGIDSGSVSVLFSAEAGGGTNGVSWSVAGATDNPLVYTSRIYGSISRVKVRVGVQNVATVTFTDIQVKFYRSGRLIESFASSSGISADSTDGNPAEQILDVVPSFTTNTKVCVSGTICLVCPDGTTPAADDLFAQVHFYSDNCAAA